MELDKELETYQRELAKLLQEHRGKFVLIHGNDVNSFWDTEDDAYTAGCERFGIEPFLVKQVREKDPPIRLLIDIAPRCPS